MVKQYENFIQSDKLNNIVKQLENRLKYWFSEKGSLNKDYNFVEITTNRNTSYSYKTIILNFNNTNFMYQFIININMKNEEDCNIKLKRYDINEQNLIDTIDDDVKIDNIKEDLLIKKLSEFDDKEESPDNIKIKTKFDNDTDNDDDDNKDKDNEVFEDENEDEFDSNDMNIGEDF